MKWGLVLEGGASRTYFSCGVMDGLLQEKMFADYVIGVSAGIAFGVSYVSRQFGRNYEILMKYESDKRYMGVRHLLNVKNRSYYNLDFVFDEVPNRLIPFDYDTFDGRNTECKAVVTKLDTGEACYLEMPEDKRFMLLRASCALPLLFQPIEVEGVRYMDGGVSDSIPFERAFEDGCDKVVTVLTRPVGYVKGYERATGLVKASYRRYPKFIESFLSRPERYNKDMEKLREYERQGKAIILAPQDTFGIGRTERDPKKLAKLYDSGMECMKKEAERIRRFVTENNG